MKPVITAVLLLTATGCQYLPMQQKESLPGFIAYQNSKHESGGHELRGYDFPKRRYF